MMPANRILMGGQAGRGRRAWRVGPGTTLQRSYLPGLPALPAAPARVSSFRRFDQFVDTLRLVERFADREARAHAPIERGRMEQLPLPLRPRGAAAVGPQNAT